MGAAGKVGQCVAGFGSFRHGSPGEARSGVAWRGAAQHGAVWLGFGVAGQVSAGTARRVRVCPKMGVLQCTRQ